MKTAVHAFLALLISTLTVGSASAQIGPLLSGTGPINRSMAGASTAAPLSASGALLWNPATLAGLERSQLDVGAELLFPHTSVSSFVPADTFGPGFPPVDMSGTTDSVSSVFALPTIALSYRPHQSNLTYGLGVFAAAGFGLDYAGSNTNPLLTAPAPNGLGFGPVFSQYQVVQIAPAVVYEATDKLALSVSPLLNIGMLQLDPSVISAPDDANGDTFATYPGGTHSRTAWGGGFSLGAFYQLTDWALGASYKSPQWFQGYQYNTSNELGQPRTSKAHLDLPSITSVGLAYQGFEHWVMALDVRYVDFEHTKGFGDSGFNADGSLRGVGFESVVAVALGVQCQLTDAMSLRMGYGYGENPIPPIQTTASVAAPLLIEHQLSAGLSYQLNQSLVCSVAYLHGFENSGTGPLVLPAGAVPGTSVTNRASVDSLSFGATVKFGCRQR